ncbi:DUF763 domain-containing protein [Halobacteriaceae archaeon GCM10025711]
MPQTVAILLSSRLRLLALSFSRATSPLPALSTFGLRRPIISLTRLPSYMSKRGTAKLPLHNGSAPRWLFSRMVDLSEAIVEVVIEEYGREELLRRLADPYWFQAFGCVLGFDWHSSGVTTTTMGALKEALDPEEHGMFVAGGKGATSRRTPDEIDDAVIRLSGSDRASLKRHSRMSAKVDNALVQDTYTLYHHTMVVTEDGDWAVVQQGMDNSYARRYHWLSDELEDLIVEPQSAIASMARPDSVLDLTAERSAETRAISVDLVQDDPSHLKQYLQPSGQQTLGDFGGGASGGFGRDVPELSMPKHHELRKSDLTERSLDQLQHAYEFQPDDYEELVELDGVGPKSLRALALISELVYNAESSRDDPAKYSYAHGGKDGTPYPVNRGRYDESVRQVKAAVEQAEIGRDEKLEAFERLSEAEDVES